LHLGIYLMFSLTNIMTKITKLISDDGEFSLQADFIDSSNLENWNVENSHFNTIQKNLIGIGDKLIVGPRGTGKTHQMRWAYKRCFNDENMPLGIYVSYSKYYHLEPFLSRAPNAIQIFHTWILSKILLACIEYVKEINSDVKLFDDDLIDENSLIEFTSLAEKGTTQIKSDNFISIISISKVISIIESLAGKLERKRVILLMDDAAFTLTPEYMIEFFDVFRSLKTQLISPKASVYPGTTEYGPRFHIGHDAQKVECWFNIEKEEEAYSVFMDELFEKRFKNNSQFVTKDIIELFKYASFGIPRAFIGLLRNYKEDSSTTPQSKFNKVIDEQAVFIKSEYISLYRKIPQYKSIIETGIQLFEKIILLMKEENKNLSQGKQILIGIKKDSNHMLERMTQFLIEAGLLYEYKNVSHGEDREYKIYIPHLLFLIQNRTFSKGSRGFNSKQILEGLQKNQRKHPIRRTFQTLLTSTQFENLKLNLPSCRYCNTMRLSEEQRFCHHCGKELIAQSAFESCLSLKINDLPLTNWQKEKIIKETNLKTVNDFITILNPSNELQKVYGFGPKTSAKILLEIKKIVDEFLV
jgi:hypothetical protein